MTADLAIIAANACAVSLAVGGGIGGGFLFLLGILFLWRDLGEQHEERDDAPPALLAGGRLVGSLRTALARHVPSELLRYNSEG